MKSKVVLVVAMMTGALLAQGPGGPGGQRHPGWPMGAGMARQGANLGNAGALKAALGLSDAQVQQLRDLRKQQAEEAKPTMDQIRAKREALAEAMKSATPDSALVGQLTVDIRKLGESLRNGRGERSSKALAILTPDQKAKLTALDEARKLMPAAGQAAALGLLEPPQGPAAERFKGAMARGGAASGGRMRRQ